MIKQLLRHWKAGEAARNRLFHAVATSTALCGLETAPLTQAISRSLDVSVTSALCVMPPEDGRGVGELLSYLKRTRRAAHAKATQQRTWWAIQRERFLTSAGHSRGCSRHGGHGG